MLIIKMILTGGCYFCRQCGTMVDGVDYPEIKGESDENQLYTSVYYGPDYYNNTKTDENPKTAKKLKGWFAWKRNKL